MTGDGLAEYRWIETVGPRLQWDKTRQAKYRSRRWIIYDRQVSRLTKLLLSRRVHGVANNLLQKIQSAQNAAVRLVTRTRRFEHITPVLRKLHWLLPVCRRVEFQLACLVRQSFAGQTSASDVQLLADTDRRSAPESLCVVPRTHNSFGDRSFSAAGPHVWNALPSYLWQDMSYRHFKQRREDRVCFHRHASIVRQTEQDYVMQVNC